MQDAAEDDDDHGLYDEESDGIARAIGDRIAALEDSGLAFNAGAGDEGLGDGDGGEGQGRGCHGAHGGRPVTGEADHVGVGGAALHWVASRKG